MTDIDPTDTADHESPDQGGDPLTVDEAKRRIKALESEASRLDDIGRHLAAYQAHAEAAKLREWLHSDSAKAQS